MINRVKTVLQLDELDTDGHNPIKFICSDNTLYYIKYRPDKSFNKNEIQYLVFEIVCSELLNALNIPTPMIALVEITKDALNPLIINHNKRYLKPGVVAFGSKEIEGADMVKKIDIITNKREFNKLNNPEDLIKIAVFDLWTENNDRYEDNLNMVTAGVDKQLRFYAIDHGFCFGGPLGMNTFNANITISPKRKLIGCQYFKHIIKYISKDKRL